MQQFDVQAYQRAMGATGRLSIAAALTASLSLGSASVGSAAYGKVDAEVVRAKIQRDLPKINRCYESALRYDPELAGKVKVRFAVARRGTVQATEILENTTGNEGVGRCVTRVVRAIRFPSRRTGKPLSFTFPFVFVQGTRTPSKTSHIP